MRILLMIVSRKDGLVSLNRNKINSSIKLVKFGNISQIEELFSYIYNIKMMYRQPKLDSISCKTLIARDA